MKLSSKIIGNKNFFKVNKNKITFCGDFFLEKRRQKDENPYFLFLEKK